MNLDTAEPIEVATVVLALLAMLASVTLLWQAWQTYRAAVAGEKCEAVLTLGLGRVVNEMIRSGISAGVGYAGVVNTLSPRPPIVTENRAIFQSIWLLIALGCFVQSLLNERNSRRVISIIEREREAGRMVRQQEQEGNP